MVTRERFLEGKVAIITGGGRGLGAVAARAFAQSGAAVTVAARTSQEIEAVADRIRNARGKALAVPTDVSDAKMVRTLVEQTMDSFSRIDFLINFAGVLHPMGKPTWETDPEAWQRSIGANLIGVYLTSHAVIPHMLRQGSGRLLHISSHASHEPVERASAYSTAKAGVNHFIRVLARELEDSGITANTFNPGPTNSPTLHEVYETLYPHATRFIERVMRDPDQAVQLILWLCSPATARISGQFIVWKDPLVQRGMAMFMRQYMPQRRRAGWSF